MRTSASIPTFLVRDYDLSRSSSFSTPARALYYTELLDGSDIARLPELFAFIRENALPYVLLGSGTNILFAFDTYEGVIIRNKLSGFILSGNTLTLGAGELISVVSRRLAKEYDNPAFVAWSRLPGTVGGAVVGNAGCYGLDISARFVEARIFDVNTQEERTMTNDEMEFDYRHSALKSRRDIIVISATFDTTVHDTITNTIAFTRSEQPTGRTCGSFFKNPKPLFAGKLIEDAGLKGTRVGGVIVSDHHANFFLNTDAATYRDILTLRDIVKATVREKFGVEMEEEVRIIENTSHPKDISLASMPVGDMIRGDTVRLQKYLSQAGICSRRKAEEYIRRELITINGRIATLGESVTIGRDTVAMRDAVIIDRESFVYYALHKPRGIVSSCQQPWEPTVIELVPDNPRVFPIGRLDKDSTGLLLLSNDGRLANKLLHPRYEHEKEYIVDIYGPISDNELQTMARGMMILGRMTRETEVRRIASGTFSIILREGRNRQIRRMVEAIGHTVKRLKRVRIENILLGSLEEWRYRHLSKAELAELFRRTEIE